MATVASGVCKSRHILVHLTSISHVVTVDFIQNAGTKTVMELPGGMFSLRRAMLVHLFISAQAPRPMVEYLPGTPHN